MKISTSQPTTIDPTALGAATGGGHKLDTFVIQQRAFAKAELKGAVCDSRAITLGRASARRLYGTPTDQQVIDAINASSNLCRSEAAAPLGARKMP